MTSDAEFCVALLPRKTSRRVLMEMAGLASGETFPGPLLNALDDLSRCSPGSSVSAIGSGVGPADRRSGFRLELGDQVYE